MTEQSPANTTEQLIRLSVAVESMVKQAEAVHKRLDKAAEEREEAHKEIHALQINLADTNNRLQNHIDRCTSQPAQQRWQERVLTPPVLIAAIVGGCILVALILGRDEAIAPIIEAVPSP